MLSALGHRGPRSGLLAALCILHPAGAEPAISAWIGRAEETDCFNALVAIGSPHALERADALVRELVSRPPRAGWSWLAALSDGARERLAPLLLAAFERREPGYDALRERLCERHQPASASLRQACRQTRPQQERLWAQEEERSARRRRIAVRVVGTVLSVGLSAAQLAVVATVKDPSARQGVNAIGGAVAGAFVVEDLWLFASRDGWRYPSAAVIALGVLTEVAGVVAGGTASYFASSTREGALATASVSAATSLASGLYFTWRK